MNYLPIEIPKGSDQDFELTVTDDAGVAIDLTSFAKVFVVLYFKDRTVLQKYSVTVATGWKTVTITGAGNNKLSFRLLSADTNLAEESKVYYEILARLTDAGSTDDTFYDTITTDQYLCTVIPSITSTLSLP